MTFCPWFVVVSYQKNYLNRLPNGCKVDGRLRSDYTPHLTSEHWSR
jgi:hypothetical protein